jgi:hypothetical protein
MEDLIGKILDGYASIERAKIEARMQASRDQLAVYDLPYRYQNAQADASETNNLARWAPVIGLGILGVLVFAVVRK